MLNQNESRTVLNKGIYFLSYGNIDAYILLKTQFFCEDQDFGKKNDKWR